MRFCSARETPPVLEASVDGEKSKEHILCCEQTCNSEPSGSNVAVAATRLNCALSNVQQSAQSHHNQSLTSLCIQTHLTHGQSLCHRA